MNEQTKTNCKKMKTRWKTKTPNIRYIDNITKYIELETYPRRMENKDIFAEIKNWKFEIKNKQKLLLFILFKKRKKRRWQYLNVIICSKFITIVLKFYLIRFSFWTFLMLIELKLCQFLIVFRVHCQWILRTNGHQSAIESGHGSQWTGQLDCH